MRPGLSYVRGKGCGAWPASHRSSLLVHYRDQLRDILGSHDMAHPRVVALAAKDEDEQEAALWPLLDDLKTGVPAPEVLDALRDTIVVLGARRRPPRLSGVNEMDRHDGLAALILRLHQQSLIPASRCTRPRVRSGRGSE